MAKIHVSSAAHFSPKTTLSQQPPTDQNQFFFSSPLLNKIHCSSIASPRWKSMFPQLPAFDQNPFFPEASYWPKPLFFTSQLLAQTHASSLATCWPNPFFVSSQLLTKIHASSVASYWPNPWLRSSQLLTKTFFFLSWQKTFFSQ